MDTVLWSVVCETIFYALYPALLFLNQRSNWQTLILGATAGTTLLLYTNQNTLRLNHNYPALGWATWVVGLPCWLIGCWLAENYHSFSIPSSRQMALIRTGIYVLTVLFNLIRFHVNSSLASNCVLLNVFAFPACLWLGLELANADHRERIQSLEWAGRWSYSLYLVHSLVPPALAAMGLSFIALGQLTHVLLLPIALFASLIFFVLVEQPFHRLAVAVGGLPKT